MAVLNADHLLAQADSLIAPASAGRPRQVDLRRGISSAYYAAFHTVVTAAADEFVGAGAQQTAEHRLVIRSIDHGTISKVCKNVPSNGLYRPYLPLYGFGPELRAFLEAFPALQDERHRADYDSFAWYTTAAAKAFVLSVRAAIAAFWAAPAAERKTFLYLILFQPKR